MKLPARLPLLLFAAALGAAWWRALPPEPAELATIQKAAPPASAPTHSQLTPDPTPKPSPSSVYAPTPIPGTGQASSHPTLAELTDGKLLAAWREGTGQQATIRLATLPDSAARIVIDCQMIADAARMHTLGLGHPLLFVQGSTLHLWVEGEHPGGPRLHAFRSSDGGASWKAGHPLLTSPLFNLGSRLAGPPLSLADGGLALPLAHDLLSSHGEWLRLDAHGRILDKARLAASPVGIARLATGQWLAALKHPTHRLAQSQDGGQRWQTIPAELPAPGIPLALRELRDGRLLLLADPGEAASPRWFVSPDQGQHWLDLGSHALPPGAALPTLRQGSDGQLHLLAATATGITQHTLRLPETREAAR